MTDYTYNTGNPIGSTDVRDGVDNLKSFDVLLNSTADTYQDRLGNTVPTAAGAIKALGPVVAAWTFTTGGTLNYPNEAALNPADGNYYGWTGTFPKVVAPGSDPTLLGSGYEPRTDVVLRGELADVGGADLVNTSDGQSVQTKINEFKLLKPQQTAAQVAKTFQAGSRPSISCFGDSTMWGATVGNLGTQSPNNAPTKLAQALGLLYGGAAFTVNNRAISGTTLRQMLSGTDGSGSTFISKISAGGVDAATKIIYCNHCINDSQLNGDIDQYRDDIVYFVNSCRANGKLPVLVTANPNPALLIINETKAKRLSYYVQTMRDVAASLAVDLVDQFELFGSSTNIFRVDEIVPDGAHLSDAAYFQAGYNLAIPFVCARTLEYFGDAAGLEQTTYFDNFSVSRSVQYQGARTGGTLVSSRPSSGYEGLNFPVILASGKKCISILGLQWNDAANCNLSINNEVASAFYQQKQFGNQSALKWDCEAKYYGKFFAGLKIITIGYNMDTHGLGTSFAFSGVSIPDLQSTSQVGANSQPDPYTKSVVCFGDSITINAIIPADGYQLTDNAGASVLRIWINSGVLTVDLYKDGSVVQTSTAGSGLSSSVFAPMQVRVDFDKIYVNYLAVTVEIPISTPLPNIKPYTAYMQYHIAPTFGV